MAPRRPRPEPGDPDDPPDLDTGTDGDLLRAADRLPAAFGALYDRHAEDLHRWFLRHGTGDEAGADLLAELFAQAWLSRRRFEDRDDGNARPWLYGIARNLLAAYRRRDRVESQARRRLGLRLDLTAAADGVDDDGVAERVDAAAAAPRLTEALASLPPGQSAAVDLRVVGELPYPDVAAALDCTDATARKRVSLGLKALRTHLGGQS
jgi:RNA polymerase sigma-70 factor (ECF subfamily)